MDIGELLKNKRLEKGLTQRAVADEVGVSEGTVSRWESGKIGNMRRDKIDALAKVLSIDPRVIAKADIPSGVTIGGAMAAPAAPIGLGAVLLELFSSTKKLMDAVGVDDDSVDNQQIDINNPPLFITRADEIKMINRYRQLSDADKIAVCGLIENLAQKYISEDKKENDDQKG
jgi:transcriptional regulator with XRE-family HTH domain